MSQTCQKKRCGALFILLLPLVILISIILIPWFIQIHFYNITATQNIEQIQRYHRANQALPQLRAQLNNPIIDTATIQKQYVRAKTPALAAATIQRKIKKLINQHHAVLESTQNISGRRYKKTAEKPVKIKIKVRMRSNIEALAAILYELETGEPTLFIDNLSLRKRNGRRIKKGSLSISFDLYGYQSK